MLPLAAIAQAVIIWRLVHDMGTVRMPDEVAGLRLDLNSHVLCFMPDGKALGLCRERAGEIAGATDCTCE